VSTEESVLSCRTCHLWVSIFSSWSHHPLPGLPHCPPQMSYHWILKYDMEDLRPVKRIGCHLPCQLTIRWLFCLVPYPSVFYLALLFRRLLKYRTIHGFSARGTGWKNEAHRGYVPDDILGEGEHLTSLKPWDFSPKEDWVYRRSGRCWPGSLSGWEGTVALLLVHSLSYKEYWLV
jgi:hypothetical protein